MHLNEDAAPVGRVRKEKSASLGVCTVGRLSDRTAIRTVAARIGRSPMAPGRALTRYVSTATRDRIASAIPLAGATGLLLLIALVLQ